MRQLIAAHPDLADDLQSFFRNRDSIEQLAQPLQAIADAPTISGPSANSRRGKPNGNRTATSATMSCSRKSPAAAWGSSTRPGR